MKTVEIYDNYTSTVSSQCKGIVEVKGTNLSDADAKALVESLYNESKGLGNYTDKLVNLEQSYAELNIDLPDGRNLNRVIYTTEA
jgi:hypothetical protein